MNLRELLDHESMRAADPVVRAGSRRLEQATVRWVHSSEVLDIGPLMLGGEFLLSGGTVLSRVSGVRQDRYIRELAAHHVAALALETGSEFPEIPRRVVQAAAEVGLPLIELRRVVPFVEIAESVNSSLVSDSVATLQRADEISHAVSVALVGGAGIRQLLEVLATELTVTVSLLVPGTLSDELLGVNGQRGDSGPAALTVDIEIALRGMLAATLRMDLQSPEQESLAQFVGDRVADVLALALLQQRRPSLGDIAGIELIRAVEADSRETALADLCESAGVDPETPLVMISARTTDSNRLRGKLDRVLAEQAARLIVYANPGETIAIALFDGRRHRSHRAALLEELERHVDDLDAAICVGPVVDGIRGGAYSLDQARLTLELSAARPSRAEVFDSDASIVDRLLTANVGSAVKIRLVDELLGEIVEHDAQRGTNLVDTLEAWLRSGCNTAETARSLFLERQSMHNRLQRIFSLIGGDPRGTGRIAGLTIALRALRQIPSKYHTI
ncbi:PucR family transcriptional regulator [Brevibacterium atlanticum]|uniref:PucR family transcriptional regulator n=1 Tax=Brevibacterium atlanticum TaxID=2697563 RepID=UPI00142457AF|nr:PucR family transcriptional regulator ligand-binding domain-containing protein [Brevibacterium atlanticum]